MPFPPHAAGQGDPVVADLAALARVPSAVPLGADTLIEPDHLTLLHYVQGCLRPMFQDLGAVDIIDLPRNQFAIATATAPGRAWHSWPTRRPSTTT